jgi:hypothetical protein
MNRKQLGNLKLSNQQEDLLVAFLKTLTDGYAGQGGNLPTGTLQRKEQRR